MGNNQQITTVESRDKPTTKEINLIQVKTTLKRALLDYEDFMREIEGETFDVYENLRDCLGEGYAEATVRRWLNIHTNEFAQPERLITLCKHIGNNKPALKLAEYLGQATQFLNR